MPPRLRFPELAPEGVAHMRALEHYLNATTALPAVLLELVRLRVSVQNRCSFCIGHHTRELEKHNEPASRIEAVRDWPSSDAFTPRERAAFAWADSVTDIQSSHAAPDLYAAAEAFFHGKDLVDLTLAISSINAWNRMSIAFGNEWDPTRAQQPAASDGSVPANGSTPVNGSTPTSAAAAPAAPSADSMQDVCNDDGGKVAHG